MFRLTTLTALALSLGSSLASPIANPLTITFPFCSFTQYEATFDDLPTTPANPLSNIPTPYNALLWQGFSYASVQPGVTPGVQPHSAPNFAVANVASELNGTPILSTNYAGSTVSAFTLQNFYYGCVLQAPNAAVSVPTQCLIEVTGYRGSSNSINGAQQVCSFTLQYTPGSNLPGQQQAFSGNIYGCFDLNFAVVQFSLPGQEVAANADLALTLDNVRYYTKTC